jgi:hypothetical protein
MSDPRQEYPFVLYDGRARLEGPEGALVLDTAETEQEARETGEDWDGMDAIWFERDKPRPDLPPADEESEEEFLQEMEKHGENKQS